MRTVELEEDGRPAVTFDDGSRAGAEVLVAADGANGICGRSLQLGEGRIFAPALEANVAYDAVGAGVEQHVALLEMGYVPGGYGWLFPKGDHANVGVGGWDSEGPHLRDHLRRVCERHDIAWSSLTEIRGHRLPMRGAATQVASGRALAVGDAAGLVDPLSGDGMYEAFSSAHVASACARDVLEGRAADLSAYPARLDAALGRHTSLAWIAKAAIERTPGIALRVARSRAIRRRFLLRTATSRDPLGRERSAPRMATGRARGPAAAGARGGRLEQAPRSSSGERGRLHSGYPRRPRAGGSRSRPRRARAARRCARPRCRPRRRARAAPSPRQTSAGSSNAKVEMFARTSSSRYASGRFHHAQRKPSVQSCAIGTGTISAPPSASATTSQRREARLVLHGDLRQVVAHEPVAARCTRGRT